MSERRSCAISGTDRGFTLLELLIVTAILGVMVTAIGACIMGGIRVWDASRVVGRAEIEILNGMALLERDLVNAFAFDAIALDGESGRIRMPGLVPGEDAGAAFGSGGGVPGIGTILYRFDSAQGVLVRETRPLVSAPGTAGAGEHVMAGLRDCRFAFQDHWNPESAASEWQDRWSSFTNWPARVSVTLLLEGGDRYETQVFLPVERER